VSDAGADLAFVGFGVRDIGASSGFYEALLGRPADVVVHAQEVMWRVSPSAWLYLRVDPERAGTGLLMLAVPDIGATLSALEGRGIARPAVEEVGGNDRATVTDPDGNEVSFAQLQR
jgi:predicted enzyme related to lactoylglutathione lyase